jgi:hypothetical protein
MHSLLTCSPLAAAGGLALARPLGWTVRCASVALGLAGSASVLVALSGGAIEAHFHYFVVVAFLSVYQEWYPFLIAIGFVLFEHGIVGVLDPAVWIRVRGNGPSSTPGSSWPRVLPICWRGGLLSEKRCMTG